MVFPCNIETTPSRKPPIPLQLTRRAILGKAVSIFLENTISDEQTEYQINDRQSFQRFLELHLGSTVPDYSSIWRYREQLSDAGVVKGLFDLFTKKWKSKE
jgi:hypothetical protein